MPTRGINIWILSHTSITTEPTFTTSSIIFLYITEIENVTFKHCHIVQKIRYCNRCSILLCTPGHSLDSENKLGGFFYLGLSRREGTCHQSTFRTILNIPRCISLLRLAAQCQHLVYSLVMEEATCSNLRGLIFSAIRGAPRD